MRRVMALVLAGGRSEGLGVLAVPRTAAALPFGGKYRVIDFTLSNCVHSEINRVALLTQHQPTSLNEHIGAGRSWDLDRQSGGVLILQPFVRRDRSRWYRGTADALAHNRNAIADSGAEVVLVASGDHVYLMDYSKLVEAHEESGAVLTLAVTVVPPRRRTRYGMVALDERNRVTRFEEKPKSTDLTWAFMGLYVFRADFLLRVLQELPGPDLVFDVIQPALAAGTRIQGFRFEGYWEDVGELGTYFRANHDLLSQPPPLVLDDPGWTVLTRNEERPPARFGESARVRDSLIAAGARIDGTVENSVVFPGVWVEEGATVRDSILFHDAWVGSGASLSCAILDKDVVVGEGARVGVGEGVDCRDPGPEGLVVVGKESVLMAGETLPRGMSVPVGGGRGRMIPPRDTAAAAARGEWPR